MSSIGMLLVIYLVIAVVSTDVEAMCLRWTIRDVLRHACFISEDGPLATFTSHSLRQCALKCVHSEDHWCHGANYIEEYARCDLYPMDNKVTLSKNCPGHVLIRLTMGDKDEDDVVNSAIHSKGSSTIGCDVGWLRYGEQCYLLEKSPQIFLQADLRCKAYTAALTSLHSAKENQFIRWMAMKHPQRSAQVYIGLIKHQGNKVNPNMVWTDTTSYDYTNWRAGQPDRVPRDAVCVVIDVRDGTWSDGSCREALPYVCRKPAGVT